MRLASQQTAVRLFPIDLLKALSIVAVVSFHTIFVDRSTYASVAPLIDCLFAPLRFSVPVLFTISFFLLKRGLEKNSDRPVYPVLKKRLIRLLIPTLFWSFLAIIVKKILWYQSAEQVLVYLLQGNIFPGTYYLIVLFQFIPVFIWLNSWFDRRRNILLTLVFQCLVFLLIYISLFGILGNSIPLLLNTIQRTLFIYWFSYMALGAYLYNNWSKIVQISHQIPIIIKILFVLLTSLTMLVEYNFLQFLTKDRVAPYEYAMFSCILSVLVCFICFASIEENKISKPVKGIIQLLATYSLGIFCIHGVIKEVLVSIFAPMFRDATFNFSEVLVMKLVGWIVLLAVSLWLSRLIDKLGFDALVR